MDIRVIKTKEILTDSFIKLMTEKKLEEITVSNICQLSRCSRSTFYMCQGPSKNVGFGSLKM